MKNLSFPSYIFFLLFIFSFSLLFECCTTSPKKVLPYNKELVETAVAKADTLSPKEAYDIARKFDTGVEQDSFYTQLLTLKMNQFSVKDLRENISFYETLRGGNLGAESLICFATGQAFQFENDLPNSLEWIEKGLAISIELKDTIGILNCSKVIAYNHYLLGDAEQATKVGIETLALAEQIQSTELIANLQLDVADYLFRNNEWNESIKMAEKTIPYFQKIGNIEKEANAFERMGRSAEFKNDYKTAAFYYDKVLELRKELNIPEALVATYGQYANFWMNQKNYDKALSAAQNAEFWLAKCEFRGMDSQIMALSGYILFKTEDVEKGKEKMEAALDLIKKNGNRYDEMFIYDSYYRIYRDIEKPRLALQYFKKYVNLKDSLYTEKNQKNISELHIQYETAEKEKEIAEIANQAQTAQLNNYKISLALLFVLAISSGLAYRQRNRQQILKQEIELSESREKLRIGELKNSQNKLESAKQELVKIAETLAIKEQFIEEMKLQGGNNIKDIAQKTSANNKASFQDLRGMQILTNEQWESFRNRFDAQFPGFQQTLKQKYLAITAAELRLFMLLKLQFDTQEIMETLGISKESVWKSRQRLSKKLKLKNTGGLNQFVNNYGAGASNHK